MDTRHQMAGGDPEQRVPEPGARLDADHLAGLDLNRHAGPRDGAFAAADEQCVLLRQFWFRFILPMSVRVVVFAADGMRILGRIPICFGRSTGAMARISAWSGIKRL